MCKSQDLQRALPKSWTGSDVKPPLPIELPSGSDLWMGGIYYGLYLLLHIISNHEEK